MKGTNTYAERQSVGNIGEQKFEEWCHDNNHKFYRIGFDEKSNHVEKFYHLNPILRNLPDYYVISGKNTMVVNVKGTCNIKQEEIVRLPEFEKAFSSKQAMLVYAFMLKDRDAPVFKTIEHILAAYNEAGEDHQWPDGKIYRTLAL